ncbi:ISL3 family transposase, partial [Brevibacillus agri]
FSFRVTNAPIEGTHNKVKVIKRRAYGYRNIERFKIRIRLECKPAI